MSNKIKIAITGTIGSGKTEVSNYLREKGYFVFDCDQYNRELLKENSVAYPLLKQNFRAAFLEGYLDKKVLAKIIFNDEEKKLQLEAILHPLIIKEMERQSTMHKPFFAEVPLLFENNLQNLFDLSVLVVCKKEVAIERLKLRGFTAEESEARIAQQMSVENKILLADEIIYNNDTLASLRAKVDELIKQYVG